MPNLMAAENAVEIVRGSSLALELTVTDEFGVAVDLTGARIIFSVKVDLQSPLLIQKSTDSPSPQVTITAARLGKAEINLSPLDTQTLAPRNYIFDVWVVLASGKRYPVVPPSLFEVKPGVTLIP